MRCCIADAEKAWEGREQARGQEEDAQRRDRGGGELHVVLVRGDGPFDSGSRRPDGIVA